MTSGLGDAVDVVTSGLGDVVDVETSGLGDPADAEASGAAEVADAVVSTAGDVAVVSGLVLASAELVGDPAVLLSVVPEQAASGATIRISASKIPRLLFISFFLQFKKSIAA